MPAPADRFVHDLERATNDHDVDALVACFAPDYHNETPVHPARGFRGAEQVRKNWTQMFAAMPDLSARVLRTATVGDTVWSEWEMDGTRPDGTAHAMRGVILFGVQDGRAAWARFYLEPLDRSASGIGEAIASATR